MPGVTRSRADDFSDPDFFLGCLFFPGTRKLQSGDPHPGRASRRQPLRDVATLIVELGLCPGEVFAIRAQDVHLAAVPAYLHIPYGKTEFRRRDVPITKCAREVLTQRISAAKGKYLFPLRVGKNAYDWTRPMNDVSHAHSEALEASGVTRFRLYDLRHTAATRAAEAGANPLELQKLLGHSDLKTTQRYVHLSKRHLAEVQRRIEKHRAEREIAEVEMQKGEATVQ